MGNKKREQARKTDKSNLKRNEQNMQYSARTTATFYLLIGDWKKKKNELRRWTGWGHLNEF